MFLSVQAYEPYTTENLALDESLLLLQYALTGENRSIVEEMIFWLRSLNLFSLNKRSVHIFYPGNFVKSKMNPYPQRPSVLLV